MGNNASVRRFRDDMQTLRNQMRQGFTETLLLQADELVENIQNAIEHNESGNLRASVRKKNVSTDTKPSVLVLAGGQLTTKRTAAGAFDYALAEEFGTEKQDPRPFFYSTVRRYRAPFAQQYKETFEETIAENNEIRARRKDNLSSLGQSQSYRGAYLLPTKR